MPRGRRKVSEPGEIFEDENDTEQDNSVVPVEVVPMVSIRVTKFGDGKVSTGRHKGAFGDIMAKRGDVLEVDANVAASMEKTGLGEVVE